MVNNLSIEIKSGAENMDISVVHHFLCYESHWAQGIPIEIVRKSMEHSFCVGIFENGSQVGFARLVTDYNVFAYLCDVFVLKEYRGRGYSKQMMGYMLNQDFIPGLRRMILTTKDAHSLYARYGFEVPQYLERFMEVRRYNLYQ